MIEDARESVALTDDEVVALALGLGRAWPASVPTVDLDDVDAVRAAGLRGERSLFVRGLVDGDGGIDPALVPILELCGAEKRLTIVVIGADLAPVPTAFVTVHYRFEEAWWLESISPVGVHEFVAADVAEHRAYVLGFLESFQSSPADAAEESVLVASAAAAYLVGRTRITEAALVGDELHVGNQTSIDLVELMDLTFPA